MLKVFGHLNPDTDSTCSAIAYAWFLNEQAMEATPYLLGAPGKEALFVLDRFKQSQPEILSSVGEGDEIVIVDTNNPEELLDLSKATLRGLVDHHKLVGGLSTSEPVEITMRTVGCTATVIWMLMQEKGVEKIPAEIAGLMLSAILSDSLKFTSPTTTETDKKAAEWLTAQAGVDVDELAAGMFDAKSDLSGMSPKDLLLSDSKVFDMAGKKVRISSLETTKPANALAMRTELVEAMQALKTEQGLDGAFFFIVDILSSSAELLLPSEFEISVAEKGFDKTATEGLIELPGVVSRKKQMVPAIEKGLAS
ncbi:MAG: manganese-dependent inorganic pyrophosphatase [bacterium]